MGVTKAEGETAADLGPKITLALSKSGVGVKVEDLSGFCQNQENVKRIKLQDGTTKIIQSTITVKFRTINLKNDVVKITETLITLRKKTADVQVYHSLSAHYSKLRRSIIDYILWYRAGTR